MRLDGRTSLTIASLFLGLLLAPVQAASGQVFLSALADVPLMTGLREVRERGLAYDKPAGRIVEAYARGAMDAAAARGYYRDALPQLGWREVATDTFERDGETLKLNFESDEAGIAIRFVLAPSR